MSDLKEIQMQQKAQRDKDEPWTEVQSCLQKKPMDFGNSGSIKSTRLTKNQNHMENLNLRR